MMPSAVPGAAGAGAGPAAATEGGTTAAALAVLMAEDGMAPLLEKAIRAARDRSVELGGSTADGILPVLDLHAVSSYFSNDAD